MTQTEYEQGIKKKILSFLKQKLQEKEKSLSKLDVISLDFSRRVVDEQIQINLLVNIERLKKSIKLLGIDKYGICKICLNNITYEEILVYPCKTKCGKCISKK
jgi:RNA polymerase-binding transcription factor DksA